MSEIQRMRNSTQKGNQTPLTLQIGRDVDLDFTKARIHARASSPALVSGFKPNKQVSFKEKKVTKNSLSSDSDNIRIMPEVDEISVSMCSSRISMTDDQQKLSMPIEKGYTSSSRKSSGETVQSMFFKNLPNSTAIEEKKLTKKIANFDEETKKLLKIEIGKYNLNSVKIHEAK